MPGLGEVPAPRMLQLEPVGQCNLRCQMCALQFRQDGPPFGPPAFMDFEVFRDIIDRSPQLEHLHLQGLGEPTMHPRFFEMVRYAVARGVRVTTNSNMTLMNDRRAEECVQSGLAEMHASIDGATAEMYERIRVRGHFERVAANVRRLIDARERAGARSPRLHIVTVLMRQNLQQLPELVALAADLGADQMFVQHLAHEFAEEALPAHYAPMRAFVDEQTILGEKPAVVADAFARAREAASAVGLQLRLPRIDGVSTEARPERVRPCDWPWTQGYISYEGLAMPCCMVGTPDRANFGSVAGRDFLEVWNGDDYRTFRAALDSPQPPAVCSSCAIYRGIF